MSNQLKLFGHGPDTIPLPSFIGGSKKWDSKHRTLKKKHLCVDFGSKFGDQFKYIQLIGSNCHLQNKTFTE